MLLGSLLLVLWVIPAVTPVVLLGLAVYALKGPKETIQALTLLVLMLLLNPGIVPVLRYNGSTLRWLVLFSAFSRTLWDSFSRGAPTPQHILHSLYLFSFVAFVLALLASYSPLISILKLVAFTVGVFTILTAFHRTVHMRAYWASWFFTLFLFVMVASLPLYGSILGYWRNGVGFQGILNHPQTYGPFAAMTTAWLTSLVLFRSNRSMPVIAGTLLGWIAIYTSLARIALLIATGGLALAIVVGMLLRPAWRPVIGRAFSGISMLLIPFLLGGLALLYGDELIETSTDFLLKGNTEESYTESFQGSRGFLIEQQMENFRAAPITGIGFGLPSDPNRIRVETGGPFDLPVRAPVEKGFMPSAVLEETGLTGAVLVLLLLVALIRPVYRHDRISVFALLLACLLINAGEMVFFSIGGMGLYFWLLVGLCYNLSTAAPVDDQPGPRRPHTVAGFSSI